MAKCVYKHRYDLNVKNSLVRFHGMEGFIYHMRKNCAHMKFVKQVVSIANNYM